MNDIAKGDRSVYEMQVIGNVLFHMATIDQLNMGNLSSAELLARRYQVIKEAHRISPGQPDYSMSDVMMGWAHRKAGVSVDLSKYVAAELKDRAAVQKEARKAREEAAQHGGGASRGRGRGRGRGDGGPPLDA